MSEMHEIVRIENLGKQYEIGTAQTKYKTLRESLSQSVIRFKQRVHSPSRHDNNKIWALRNISCTIELGEVIGIIGRNGAGKSTLLKLLSRVTKPTEGRALIRGRVGSLLEVGTGFHPELTGRENVYLNGAILGMSRREINQKFDEIVAFAEVEKFLDTPVKRYSSGMHMRLAFAVAAHLEPEILIVDEVLAVGDAAFQNKCLGKMENVARTGRTIILVSHQMTAIRRLCDRCLWLEGGRLKAVGATPEIVSQYEFSFKDNGRTEKREMDILPDVSARFRNWYIEYPKSEMSHILITTEEVTFRVDIQVNKSIPRGRVGIALYNDSQQLMWAWREDRLEFAPGINYLKFSFLSLPLRPGNYAWLFSLFDENELIDLWHAFPQLVIAAPPLTHPLDNWVGLLNIACKFEVKGSADEVNIF